MQAAEANFGSLVGHETVSNQFQNARAFVLQMSYQLSGHGGPVRRGQWRSAQHLRPRQGSTYPGTVITIMRDDESQVSPIFLSEYSVDI